MMTKNKRLIGIVAFVAFLLFIPFVAMRFTNEVNWTSLDFLVAAVLLLGTGLGCELILRTVKSFKYRLVICAAVLLLFALVWIELAVGIFGTRFAGS